MAKKTARGNAPRVNPETIPGVRKGVDDSHNPVTDEFLRSLAQSRGRIIDATHAAPEFQPPDPAEFTLSAKEAAQRIGKKSAKTIQRAADQGKIPHYRDGLGETAPYMFRPADIDAFNASSRRYFPATDESFMPPESVDVETNPEVAKIVESNKSLFRGWTDGDFRELYSMHGTGGPLTKDGVIQAANRINRKRTLRDKFEAIMESDEGHVKTLTTMIEAIYKEVTVRPKR